MNEKFQVGAVLESDLSALKELFCAYYAELDCEDDPSPLVDDCLLPDLKAELLEVAVCRDGDVCGFIIYQIDDVINDWNFKEGCGDVRELFVLKEKRGNGAGMALLRFAEKRLKDMNAREVYLLPTEESEKFFLKCGYSDSGEYCPEMDNKVFSKAMDKTDKV